MHEVVIAANNELVTYIIQMLNTKHVHRKYVETIFVKRCYANTKKHIWIEEDTGMSYKKYT